MPRINYGPSVVELDIPPANLAFDLRPAAFAPPADQIAEILGSLQAPVGCARLRDLVRPGAKIILLGDDRTRLTPQHIIIPVVLDELNAGGIRDEHVSLLIAYGTHRPMTDAEVLAKFGPEVVKRIRILHHDCRDDRRLVDRGTTRRGTRIWINRDYMEADFRIGIGGILPHHPVGWSGGAKILLPGVAGQETVCAMHLLGATEQQLGKVLTPCREEMEDFAAEVGLQFIVNVVFDNEGNILKSVAGQFIAAHREAVQWGMKVFGVGFAQKADITLSSTYPSDYDLTQSDKGLFSAELATKPGGEIILVSPCPEGIAPTHGEEMARIGCCDDDELWHLLKTNQINDRFCAAECMYLNHIKRHFKATLMMDPVNANLMGFHYLGGQDLAAYIKRRLELHPGLKIGLMHQSSELLPIEIAHSP